MIVQGDPREQNERLNAEWLRQRYELTQRVQEWFVAATAGTRAAVPPMGACAYVATRLLTIRQYHAHGHKPPPEVVAIKAKWRSVHRELRKLNSSPSFGFGETGDRVGFGQGPFDDFRAATKEGAQHMDRVLIFLGAQDPLDPIRYVADAAREAWRQAGSVPRSLAPHKPLCTFVGRALEYLGMRRSQETVSAVLRGRRRCRER